MNAYSQSSTPRQPPQPGTGALPQNMWASAGGAYTMTPQQNAFTSNNLNSLISGNSQYIQNARNAAMAGSAANGLGGSSYAAGNAQLAAINAAMPIAQADAQTNEQSALANQDALNKVLMGNNQDATMRFDASTQAGAMASAAAANAHASMYNSDNSLKANTYGVDQMLVRQNAQNQFTQQDQQNMGAMNNYYGTQAWERNNVGQALQTGLNTVTSNPDYFSNPQASMGMVNGLTNFVGNYLNQYSYGNQPPPNSAQPTNQPLYNAQPG